MKQKLIFTDIDGTLYGKNFTLSSETLKFISQISNLNAIVILNTGNSFASRIKKLAADLNVNYVLTSNGALLSDIKADKHYITKGVFAKELQEFVLKIASELNMQCNFWNTSTFFSFNPKSEFADSYNFALLDTNDVVFVDQPQNDVIKMELFGTNEQREQAFQIIQKNPKISAVAVSGINIEITPENVSKGSGLEFVCKMLDFEVENAMAIGDSANDISMLKLTPYSYAMANAHPEVKKIAKLNTSACDQDGVVLAIKDYLYRTKNLK